MTILKTRNQYTTEYKKEMKYHFIQDHQSHYPVTIFCRVMAVSRRAYYDWIRSGTQIISSQTWGLYQRMKALFAESRSSLGSRQVMKQLHKEGHTIGRYRVRSLMKKLA